MIRIYFKDIDWLDSEGNVIPMSYPNEIITYGRIIARHQQPIITNDSWGGTTYPVQITINEAYKVAFAVKEASIHHLAKIISCKTIQIYEYATNDIIDINTESEGQINITTSHNGSADVAVEMEFTGKKISIYPGIARLNANLLRIINNGTNNFYTDKSILSVITDPELESHTRDSGLIKVSKSVIKQGKKMVFYLMETNAILLKKLIYGTWPENIVINPNTDNIVPIEMGNVEMIELSEGIYKLIVTFTTVNTLSYVENIS
jgi:hypothetical protein